MLSNRRIGKQHTTRLMDSSAGVPGPPKLPPKSFNREALVLAVREHLGAASAEVHGLRLKRRDGAERLATRLLEEIAGALERGLRVGLRGLGALIVKPKR